MKSLLPSSILVMLLATVHIAAALPQSPNEAAKALKPRACDGINTSNWDASGGCKANWSGRCQAKCDEEAGAHEYCGGTITSNVSWLFNCVPGWKVCHCHCWRWSL